MPITDVHCWTTQSQRNSPGLTLVINRHEKHYPWKLSKATATCTCTSAGLLLDSIEIKSFILKMFALLSSASSPRHLISTMFLTGTILHHVQVASSALLFGHNKMDKSLSFNHCLLCTASVTKTSHVGCFKQGCLAVGSTSMSITFDRSNRGVQFE